MVESPQEDHSQPQAPPVMSDLLHNIMSENASSSDERPINRDL